MIMQYIKFGFGRCLRDTSRLLQHNHLDRKTALDYIKKYDGEFPERYFKDILDYLNLSESSFFRYCNSARSPHLWKKIKNKWKLRHTVNMNGTDD